MSVEIHFGAGPSVTKHAPVQAEVRGLGAVGNEVGSTGVYTVDLAREERLVEAGGGGPKNEELPWVRIVERRGEYCWSYFNSDWQGVPILLGQVVWQSVRGWLKS
jgi:hypothetical protein